jgi:hypothetical protein
MVLQQFNKFTFTHVITLYVLNILLKVGFIIYPAVANIQQFTTSKGLLLYPFFNQWVQNHTFVMWLAGVHIIFFGALAINNFMINQRLSNVNSLTPAVSIILTTSLLQIGFWINVNYLVLLLIMISLIYLFKSIRASKSSILVYTAGAAIGTIILLQSNLLLLLPVMFICCMIIKAATPKDLIAYILGAISPSFVLISLLWLFAPEIMAKQSLQKYQFPNVYFYKGAFAITLIVLLASIIKSYSLTKQINEIGAILIKKKMYIIRLLTLATCLCLILVQNVPSQGFILVYALCGIIIHPIFNIALNKRWANISFILFIIVILINQYLIR